LARTIEVDVIPRLVLAHRGPGTGAGTLTATRGAVGIGEADVQAFVTQVIADSEAEVGSTLSRWRQRGASVESLYLDLLGPAARRLGHLWEEDLCDFATVTVALGRLQRLLRELSPAFGAEVDHPTHGRRALFVQPRDEQHSFGLSMVAEFFRREGWDVLGGVGGAVTDPAGKVRDEWVDVIGFSVGAEARLPWLVETIVAVRASARNPDLVVLAGGPAFMAKPHLVAQVGADGTARDAKEAPKVAEALLSRRRTAG
jgi:methanogenic corrinoid protein MtbC1